MALHNSLHTGSAARAVLSAQDARLALAGLLALNGPGPLDVRPGIMYAPGNPGLVTGDTSTGPWRYTVAAGSFVTTKGNLDGPHLSTNDGNTLVSTIVPPGSNSRYDVIYAMQLDMDATISPDGSTAPLLGVVNGAAAASPSIPAAPAGAIVLATALILSTAIGGTSGVGVTLNTLVSRFTTTRNDPIPVRNATERAEVTAYDGATVYRLDLHATETYNGTGWGLASATVSASLTTNSAGFSVAAGIILDAPSITGDGVKKFKITVSAFQMQSSVAGDRFDMKIQDSTTGTYLQSFRALTSSTLDTSGITIVVTDVPAAGPHVYRFIGLRVAGTGTGFVYATAVTPTQIIVEQIA